MFAHLPRRIRDKWYPEPMPPAGSFEGQTVLVTGATSGLGLAAATHFVALGANVIVTARNKTGGEIAQRKIMASAGATNHAKVKVMELDMSRYSSCMDFFNELKEHRSGEGGLDCAVLNAGCINRHFTESPEGREQTIQVNALSTTLLGLLISKWMKQERPNRITPAHLVFISSRSHIAPDFMKWPGYSNNGGLLNRLCAEENFPLDVENPNYPNSKLLLMYNIEEMSKQALGQDGTPQVIVNSVCPGIVYTDIASPKAHEPLLRQLVVRLFMTLIGKKPEYGARFYVKAALKTPEEHGTFVESLDTEEGYRE
ncbi:Uu.00g129950.m01.CDS01 [Anthostomella pinea]|uniref:Uu.00g129950.m01.CDS01 n=1 Tax=Anthostomella pinea TaxID=933095 RepID=A0AAI8VJ71_9PEZI|nr:Uu.00g129950.m01.CDS01 [Anthostomella pinea]